ncbi:MAG: hypothetical protein M1838_004651 [Thelocarpon superellum]|nr:MAG: hypothetical protein M1838_004651 [Thelocarpon superellum]
MDTDSSTQGLSMTPEAIDAMSPATPSPTTPAAPNAASRRPPRKSTLTQQQKNQKRQRATQDQLATLEVEFNQNPTPTAVVRERIAQDINMTERSVQIWFQNRRAKIKLLAKKSIETGEDCDAIPESMRQYLALQAIESGKPLGRSFPGRNGGPLDPFGNAGLLLNAESNNPSKVVIHHFACRSLSIGSWRRVGQNAMDLVIFYSPDKACITYYINNDSAGYKIEYPFAYIKNITLEAGDMSPNAQANGHNPGGLLIELTRPPNFFMDSSGSGGFYQCGDFTEDQQASRVMVHHLGGHPKVLRGQLTKLVSLESFQTRHAPLDQPILSVSAPVSPGPHRPASQPNHLTHPHVGMFQERQYGVNLHPARGHKRQRSRSVPVAVDFSMLHQPMGGFNFTPDAPAPMHNPNLFAPAPMHQPVPVHHPAPMAQQQAYGPLATNLRIDTSNDFGMDFRQFPISAGTTVSPSEYASPAFFTSGAPSDGMPTANFQTPYSLPFLTPMPDVSGMAGPSISPLSAGSHGDPVIANQSPPLSGMDRTGSTDFLQLSHDMSNMSDDGLALSELYSKQSLNLPMHSHSPGMEGSADDLAMQSMVTFDSIDPSSESPENHAL